MALSVYIRIIPVRSTRTLRSVRPVHHLKTASLFQRNNIGEIAKAVNKYSVVENNQTFTLNSVKSSFVDYEYGDYRIRQTVKFQKNAPVSRNFLLMKSAENKRRKKCISIISKKSNLRA
uniref:hypothetical protein n=1 Tax=Eubacterium sp. TaxID=142586 RepID=UPI003FEE6408